MMYTDITRFYAAMHAMNRVHAAIGLQLGCMFHSKGIETYSSGKHFPRRQGHFSGQIPGVVSRSLRQ